MRKQLHYTYTHKTKKVKTKFKKKNNNKQAISDTHQPNHKITLRFLTEPHQQFHISKQEKHIVNNNL